MHILIIHGVNLNMLGYRSKGHYGSFSLQQLEQEIRAYAELFEIKTSFFQSNAEHEIVGKIHEAVLSKKWNAILINPGAFTHYSYAIRDALEMFPNNYEVHISDVLNREEFRKHSVIEDVCQYRIYGKGINGYFEMIDYIIKGSQQ